MADDKQSISVRIPAPIKTALEANAEREDRTLSAEVTRALRQYTQSLSKAA